MKEHRNMASAAEQMAANLSWGALGKATDLRNRIFFTLGLLIVYRIGTYHPGAGHRRRGCVRSWTRFPAASAAC
jgi:preprotein translocase subunit SecY